jgi:hypothetical protein
MINKKKTWSWSAKALFSYQLLEVSYQFSVVNF